MSTITLTPVAGSSLIAADGWNDDETTLAVKYHNGRLFEFRGLSPAIHSAYETAESKGKYLKRSIETIVKGVEV